MDTEKIVDLEKNPLAGVEELRRLAGASGWHREWAWEGFTAEEVLNILRAISASRWDVMADQLTWEERRYAAEHGRLSEECDHRLDEELA
jgi:hypothetical protein